MHKVGLIVGREWSCIIRGFASWATDSLPQRKRPMVLWKHSRAATTAISSPCNGIPRRSQRVTRSRAGSSRTSSRRPPNGAGRGAERGMQRRVGALTLAAAASAMLSSCANAQRSQPGTVTQMVAGTRIEVFYHRPVARGRPLFGALVPWGRIWTPSADSAARFTVSAPVTVNGAALAAGTYGIWAIPDSTEWTVIFSGQAGAFPLPYPDGKDVLRVRTTPLRGED